MASSNFQYFYNELGFQQENLLMYYDFRSGTGLLMPNVASGQSGNYAATISSGTSIFNRSGSAYFDGQASLKIGADPSTALSGKSFDNFTMGFCFDRSGNSNGLLFSSLMQQTNVGSGFNIGINAANALFFETRDQNGPVMITSKINLGSKNLFYLSKSSNEISFNYFNPSTRLLETDSYFVPSNFVLASSDWTIGKTNGHSPSWSTTGDYKGWLDEFFYVDAVFNPDDFARSLSGFYVSGIETVRVSGEVCATGVTGHQSVITLSTGITGYSSSTYPIYENQVSNISGLFAVSGGEVFNYNYVVIDTGNCGDLIYSGIKDISQITNYVYSGGFINQQVIVGSGILITPLSGVISTSGQFPVSGVVCESFLSGIQTNYSLNNDFLISLGMERVSSYGAIRFGDFFETYVAPSSYGVGAVSIEPQFDFNSSSFVINNQSLNIPTNQNILCQLYVNGLYQNSGSFFVSGDIYNNTTVLLGDYYLQNQGLFSSGFYTDTDRAVIDLVSRQQLSGSHASGSTSFGLATYGDSGNVSSSFVFYNGQKMISGRNYHASGAQNITGINLPFRDISGRISFAQQVTGANGAVMLDARLLSSGSGLAAYANKFLRGTSRPFFNGIRQSRAQFREGSNWDLCRNAAGNISSDLIYENENSFWNTGNISFS